MKLSQTIGFASALLLLAAGCAHEESSMRTDETVSPNYGYSYSGQTGYNSQNNVSSPSTSSLYTGNGGINSSATPQGSQAQSDNATVAQVRETLRRDPEIAFVVPNIQISANNGAIILSGSVQSEEQKRQILSKVQQVSGVITVNNQLNVMAGPRGGQGTEASPLNPTGTSGSDRLYKDAADGQDRSTNNVLNPTSRDNGPSQLYRESNQGTQGSMNNSTNSLNPTSRENGGNQIYQENPGEKAADQNSNSNTNTNNNQHMP